MKPVEPVRVVDRFLPLAGELHSLLEQLSEDEWAAPTVCGDWTVQDVAAHLLGGSLGRLQPPSRKTTGLITGPISFDDLTAMINRRNANWVAAAQMIPPRVIIEFLMLTDRQLDDHFRSLPLEAPASIGVAWAGDGPAPIWFDLAREYTEKWLHQQHIRMAVGRPILDEWCWLHPVFETFVRALPRTYRNTIAPNGAIVTVDITGPAGGTWSIQNEKTGWVLYDGAPTYSSCHLKVPQDTAWRLFTRGIRMEEAAPFLQMDGDQELGNVFLNTVAIMA
jgi:uncharacterized protein (TIGR03083 family)